MTPREKAIELVNKFRDHVNPYFGSSMLSIPRYNKDTVVSQAQMCALECAREVVKALHNGSPLTFWDNVLSEIKSIKTEDIFNKESTPDLFK